MPKNVVELDMTEEEFYGVMAAEMYAAAFRVYRESFDAVGSFRRHEDFSAYECAQVVALVRSGSLAAARARLVPGITKVGT